MPPRKFFSPRLGLGISLAALVISLTLGNARAQSTEVCGPAPAVQAALDQLPRHTPALTDWQFHQQRVAALEALLRQYPDDVFIQRAYINLMYSTSDKDKVIAEFKARHERNPDDPQSAYLYGLTLVGRQSPEAIKLFSAALEKDPKFALPHLQLVSIYSSPVFMNKEQRVAHLKAFLAACPATLEGYDPLTRIDDKDLQRTYAPKLRSLLASRDDVDAVGAYPTLW